MLQSGEKYSDAAMNAQDRTFYQSLLNRGLGSDGVLADHRSLSQTAEQFWVLVDELINRREKR